MGENLNCQMEEEFEDTKGAIRIRISKKNRQHNGQKKKVQKGKEDIYWIGAETTNRSLLTSASLVVQELLTLPEDLSSPPGF